MSSSGGADAGVDSSSGGALPEAGPEADADADADASPEASIPIPLNCGDGTVQEAAGEECDQGAAVNGTTDSGCNPACRWVCIQGVREGTCQKDRCNGPERCSEEHKCLPSLGNRPDGTVCGQSHVCRSGVCGLADVICGDRLIVPGFEECEDLNRTPGDGCENDCRFTCVLGDTTRDCRPADPCEGASTCEPFQHICSGRTPLRDLTPCGVSGEDKKCVSGACTTRYCGNGDVDPGEECDDQNDFDGDGCDRCKFSCVATDATRDCSGANECYEDGVCSAQHTCPEPVAKAAGTACGAAGNYCMMGTCVTPTCGDGVKGANEACDDGNTNDKDGCERTCAVECVNANADCRKAGGQPDAPLCRVPACVDGQCDSAPGPDGATCNAGSGEAMCVGGACTAGTCGNGTREVGEQCDRGSSNGPAAGCEGDCRLTCQVPADCADGDPCNGVESCNTTTNRCEPGTRKPDGDVCGAGRICLAGGCHRSVCGDNHWDQPGGEGCDPPNTTGCDAQCTALEVCDLSGPWALRIDASVNWGGSAPGIQYGEGTISQWAKVVITPTGPTFTASIVPCAIVVPDFEFHFEGLIEHEWFGLVFDSSFAGIPAVSTTGRLNNLSPGAVVNVAPASVLIGLTMPNPFDPTWPDEVWDLDAIPGVEFPDVDGDGAPGITVSVKTGTRPGSGEAYRNVPVNLTNLPEVGRADELNVVVRQMASQTGRLDTCTTMSGTADVTAINVHVPGCHRDTGVACVDAETNVADLARPIHTVTGATFRAVKVAADTCAAVKGAFP